MPISPPSRRRALECGMLFAALPVGLSFLHLNRMLLLVMWVLTLLCLRSLQRDAAFDNARLWNKEAVTRRNLYPILLRFLVCAALLGLATLWLEPQNLFSFPRRNPMFWALIMVLYPTLSAYPQELIYRAFFFHRYRALFSDGRMLILASGAAFGLMHLVLHNGVAVGLSLVGGMMFGSTYARHRSLLLVTIEHALYGCFIFTIGLGHYFYTGANH